MATPSQTQGSASTAEQPRASIVFTIPPPVTVWLQFDDGSQLGLAPSPERIARSILGMPLFSGLPIVMVPGMGGALGAGGFERQLHELFMRQQTEQQGPPPTSKDFLEKIPVKIWNNAAKEGEKCTDCSICLCDYEDNDQVLPLPCGHQFHIECGMKWLVEHNVCPTCRYALPTQQTNVVKPETTAATPAAPAAPQPESVTEDDAARIRVRQRSPRHDPARIVRRRLSEMELVEIPSRAAASEDDLLNSILEEEATRFVEEEQEKRRIAEVTFDDIDVEELLNETSTST